MSIQLFPTHQYNIPTTHIPQGTMGRTAEQMARAKEIKQKTELQGKVQEATKEAYQDATSTPTNLPEDMKGLMSGPTPSPFDPDKYEKARYERLTAIDPRLAEQDRQLSVKNKLAELKDATDMQIHRNETMRVAFDLYRAGEKDRAMDLFSTVAPKGQRPIGFSATKNPDIFIEHNEDGTNHPFSYTQMRDALVSSTELFKAQQTMLLHMSDKHLKEEELHADEVPGPYGPVKRTSITQLYQNSKEMQAYKYLSGKEADKAQWAPEGTPQKEFYNQQVKLAQGLKSEVDWAKENMGIDLTGKENANYTHPNPVANRAPIPNYPKKGEAALLPVPPSAEQSTNGDVWQGSNGETKVFANGKWNSRQELIDSGYKEKDLDSYIKKHTKAK